MPESHEKLIGEPIPEFDGGTFVISHLSRSPEGFSVQTVNSLRRHEPNTPLPEARRIAQKRKSEPVNLRVGSIHVTRKSGQTPQELRDQLLSRHPKLKSEDIIVENDHVRLLPGFTLKTGIRNVQRDGNTLLIDTIPVTFPTFLAINSPFETPESLGISTPAATSLILLTSEANGSHKMVFQHRSEKNRLYGDIPGASVAGYFDAVLNSRKDHKGTIMDIDTSTIKENVIREMGEEIGVWEKEVTSLVITGIATDKVKIHDEFLLLGTTSLSAQELGERIGHGDYFKFSEKFFTVDATSTNIEKLLTKVKCPLPPTHTAAFLAAGYLIVLRESGLAAAEKWKQRVTDGIKRNYEEIDAIVKTFYEQNPLELNNIPDGKPSRNPVGYDPAYLPAAQGLPGAISEFKRVGLI